MMMSAERSRRWLIALIVTGVAVRVAAGLARGPDDFIHDGYEFYLTLSRNLLDGVGLCYSAEGGCAARMPVYPLWLSLFVATDTVYPGVIVAQSMLGAILTWVAFHIGVQLFDLRVGLIAAAATALSPYAVMHDTALQDTVVVNVAMALSILLMLRAQRDAATWGWVSAGVMLSIAVLTNARIGLFVPLAIAWTAVTGAGTRLSRLRATTAIALPLIVLIGGWTLRNWRVVGEPVLTTELGEQLWFANNQSTFVHFPERSIDLAAEELPSNTRTLLDQFPGTEPERDAMVRRWAIDYMRENPGRTAINAWRKIWIAASAQLSPARGVLVQFGYAAVYLPIHVLAAISLWRMRTGWRRHSLVWLLLIAFALTTASFWAHTSHKSYLDSVLFVYAAATICTVRSTRAAAGAEMI
jgi:hypothetical protein